MLQTEALKVHELVTQFRPSISSGDCGLELTFPFLSDVETFMEGTFILYNSDVTNENLIGKLL